MAVQFFRAASAVKGDVDRDDGPEIDASSDIGIDNRGASRRSARGRNPT